EKMEEYRMNTGFEQIDIAKLRNFFLQQTGGNEEMDKATFLALDCISINPLRDRIAYIFGFEVRKTIDFMEFLTAAANFNGPGRKEVKIRTAFRLQDMDNDGVISKVDLLVYLRIITKESLLDFEYNELVSKVIHETSSDPNMETISLQDFQRVVAKSDFESKIHLSFC
ncbi:CNB1, partial [Symbiodinium microadriaticum]